MIFLDKVKNMKIYKTSLYLPTLVDDKKRGSLIFLLSPNYNASKKILNSDLLINRLRYESYYVEKDLSYYIGGKNIEEHDLDIDEVDESYNYQSLNEMTSKERNELPDEAFGIPSKRAYPLNDEKHVRSAIKFFNYVDADDEAELARNIIKAMKKFNITDVHVSEKNRFSKYYKNPVSESAEYISDTPRTCPICNQVKTNMIQVNINGHAAYICKDCKDEKFYNPLQTESYKSDDLISNVSENGLILDDKLVIFNEDAKYDSQLKRLLYKQRLRKRKEVLALYDIARSDCKFIRYTYPDLERYNKRNLFIDLYFYINLYLENNKWVQQRGFNLFYDFMSRILNDKKYHNNGYSKKTIFIPIKDWDRFHDSNVWNFRKNINPISIIYNLMYKEDIGKLKQLLGNTDIVFISDTCYFKLNLSEIENNKIKSFSNKFRMFVTKICNNEEFDQEDIDTSADNTQSEEAIKANIIDDIDVNKHIDITPHMAAIEREKKSTKKDEKSSVDNTKIISKQTSDGMRKQENLDKKLNKRKPELKISKLANNDKTITTKYATQNAKKMELAKKIDKAAQNAKSEDELYDNLDNYDSELDTASIVQLLNDLQADDKSSVDLSLGRSTRLSELDKKIMDTEVKGKSVKDIINEPDKEKETTNLNISTTNDNMKNLSFINFDKNYNIDKDIIRCFKHFTNTSYPLAIKNISVENTSTSEDRIETYNVQMEDYKGKRFTVKLDIPIMEDNRFLLRGNNQSIQMQLMNMPIIKTNIDQCQIISNYMKIFVYRVGDTRGRTLPLASKFTKAALKYKGNNIKVTKGNCLKVCDHYELPIDYIGISEEISKIETPDFIIYFNQDEINSLYDVNYTLGFPYMYKKKSKELVYMSPETTETFINILLDIFESEAKYNDFVNLIDKSPSPVRCAYSRCSIMNTDIPTVIICAYHEGLRKTLDKANIKYKIVDKLSPEDRHNRLYDYIAFNDGYLVYDSTYEASLLLNGFKVCPTDQYSITEIDNRNMYLEFLDDFGGRIKADGLDNFYDLMIDPITEDVLKYYKFPTDYISILLYANMLLADNKYIKHTNMSSRRLRRYELISVYVYKVLAEAYGTYANQTKHSSAAAEFHIKRSAVINMFLTDSISSADSCINALRDIETTNAITTKGPSGMNSDRAYSLDKRTYDESMINIIGMSTGFAANVGVTRQATIDANVNDVRGYVEESNGDTDQMNTAKTLTATEALTPFGTTHDDPIRTAMTFIQTAKHQVRTVDSDPLLVTYGTDEALPYMTSNKFAYKAKKDGVIEEINDDYIIVKYNDNTYDYINLEETTEHNSDGGYYVPLQLSKNDNISKGTKVKANQIIAYDKLSFSNSLGESDNLAYNIGTLAKVAVLNTDDGFEDSGVISENLAKKLTTPIILMYPQVIEKDATIYSIAKVGDKVEVGDPLLIWQDNYQDEDTKALLKLLSKDEVSELGKKKIEAEVTGVVKDIKIYRTLDIEDMSESLQLIVKEYEDKYNKLSKKLENYKIDKSKIPAHYILPPEGKLKRAQDAIYIEFYLEYRDTVGAGDKIVFQSANKAVIRAITPSAVVPTSSFRPDEPIDAIVSEVSLSKRMVQSTVISGSLNKLMVELDRSVKDIMGIPYDVKKL